MVLVEAEIVGNKLPTLRCWEIVDAAGTKFALPGKSIYMEDGAG